MYALLSNNTYRHVYGRGGQVPVERKSYRLSRHHGLNLMPMCMTEFQFLLLRVQSRFAETRFAETLTLTLTLHPNFGESGFGESGKHLTDRQA